MLAAFIINILHNIDVRVFSVVLFTDLCFCPHHSETLQLLLDPFTTLETSMFQLKLCRNNRKSFTTNIKTRTVPLHPELSTRPKMNAGDLQHSTHHNNFSTAYTPKCPLDVLTVSAAQTVSSELLGFGF